MTVSASVKPRCKNCQVARRKHKLYIICKDPNHKQRQG